MSGLLPTETEVRATDPVMRFMEAVYPGNAHLALASFNEAKALTDAAQLIEQQRAALVKSVEVIQTWHNQGIPVRECSKLWDIYWRNAPEMKPIREALHTGLETSRG